MDQVKNIAPVTVATLQCCNIMCLFTFDCQSFTHRSF